MLCWAATGSPHVEFEDHQQLITYFVGPDDTGYDEDPTSRAVFMQKGVICFHTCFRVARIPIVHLVELCAQTYPAHNDEGHATEPFSLQQAIDNWLMLQILAGIGRHSIL